MPKQESKIESTVCRYAASKGCYVRKFKAPGQRGVPDRLFLTPNGVVFFIEFKAPGKELISDGLQAREIREIKKRNGNATWTNNVAAGKDIIDYYLKHEPTNQTLRNTKEGHSMVSD